MENPFKKSQMMCVVCGLHDIHLRIICPVETSLRLGGNILVCLHQFSIYCCSVYSTFLLLFASICSIVIKFWFTN